MEINGPLWDEHVKLAKLRTDLYNTMQGGDEKAIEEALSAMQEQEKVVAELEGEQP